MKVKQKKTTITPVPPPLPDGTCPICRRHKVCEEPATAGINSLACLCGYRYYGVGYYSTREAREHWLQEEKKRILEENKRLGLYHEGSKDKTKKPHTREAGANGANVRKPTRVGRQEMTVTSCGFPSETWLRDPENGWEIFSRTSSTGSSVK